MDLFFAFNVGRLKSGLGVYSGHSKYVMPLCRKGLRSRMMSWSEGTLQPCIAAMEARISARELLAFRTVSSLLLTASALSLGLGPPLASFFPAPCFFLMTAGPHLRSGYSVGL